MAEYDPKIILKLADRLYGQANYILVIYPLFIGILLVVIFRFAVNLFHSGKGDDLIIFLIGALIGFLYGLEKAFKLKLEAQTALCQLKIEENSRK